MRICTSPHLSILDHWDWSFNILLSKAAIINVHGHLEQKNSVGVLKQSFLLTDHTLRESTGVCASLFEVCPSRPWQQYFLDAWFAVNPQKITKLVGRTHAPHWDLRWGANTDLLDFFTTWTFIFRWRSWIFFKKSRVILFLKDEIAGLIQFQLTQALRDSKATTYFLPHDHDGWLILGSWGRGQVPNSMDGLGLMWPNLPIQLRQEAHMNWEEWKSGSKLIYSDLVACVIHKGIYILGHGNRTKYVRMAESLSTLAK